MKKLLYLFLIIGIGQQVQAQNDVIFTHFMFNKLAYNPAYAGSKDVLDLQAIYRNQWLGIEGAPTTFSATAHTPFSGNRAGIGLSIMQDQIGMINSQNFALSYAYKLKLNDKVTLSLGVQAALERAAIDWTQAEFIDAQDQSIQSAEESNSSPNFGAGAYLYAQNFYIGASLPRLLNSATYNSLNINDLGDGDSKTAYLMAGYVFELSPNVAFKPSVLVSLNSGAPLDLDLNANFLFFKSLWIGGSYRLDDSFDAIVQFEINNRLRIGGAFDFTTSELNKFSNGSYEILVGYTFNCTDCTVKSLRYF